MLSSAATIRRLAALCVAIVVAASAGVASAQCSTCAQPAMSYAPAAQTAYIPVAQTAYMPAAQPAYSPVYQTTTTPGWYPGMYLRRLFGMGDPAVSTTYATAAYQPTYPPSYNVGYAPASYNVGYAPTAYNAGYAPASYSVGYAPTSYTAGYRAVTLSPVSPCCDTGCSACSSCGGAVQAGYESSCPNCAGGASQAIYTESPSNYGGQDYGQSYGNEPTPAPAIDPNAAVREQRQKPPAEANPNEDSVLEGDEATYFRAPELYAPNGNDRVTRAPSAPVWNAVYKQDNRVQQVSAAVQRPAPAPRHIKSDASIWSSTK
ncbi:hypothetical protein Pla123a_29670 [Posidoniimonas polymericola]|uniref:Uncharacterized protein n=2 Tax=Posidoniimonas polymericola TaxID=2528002 RepID=A0A5C5YKY3_9BACT|nr:hypothetical protein Pla123a_29670 [Posidoniimonas polymericola]